MAKQQVSVGSKFFNSCARVSVELIILNGKMFGVIPRNYTFCNCCANSAGCEDFKNGIIPKKSCEEGLLDSMEIRRVADETQDVRRSRNEQKVAMPALA